MSELKAGDHPRPLPFVHAELGDEGIFRHLGVDHEHPVDRRLGPEVARQTHRVLHEEES
jgi:hypothetical protein